MRGGRPFSPWLSRNIRCRHLVSGHICGAAWPFFLFIIPVTTGYIGVPLGEGRVPGRHDIHRMSVFLPTNANHTNLKPNTQGPVPTPTSKRHKRTIRSEKISRVKSNVTLFCVRVGVSSSLVAFPRIMESDERDGRVSMRKESYPQLRSLRVCTMMLDSAKGKGIFLAYNFKSGSFLARPCDITC